MIKNDVQNVLMTSLKKPKKLNEKLKILICGLKNENKYFKHIPNNGPQSQCA